MDKEFDSNYRITFRIKHPYISFAEVADQLKIEPRFGWNVGERARNKENKEFGSIKNYTYYYFCINYSEATGISEELVMFLNDIKKHKSFLDSLTRSGGSLSIYLAWFVEKSLVGNIFHSDLLKDISDLHINFEMEIYPDAS